MEDMILLNSGVKTYFSFQFIFDYHDIIIEEPLTWRVPLNAFIGGYPTARTLRMGSKTVSFSLEHSSLKSI